MKESDCHRNVLIVDDTPSSVRILREALKSDYEITFATNGEDALRMARSDNPPDLILLDIMMPGMDGYQICRQLKADQKTQSIPVIFVTAKDREHDETMGLEMGAADYIRKPFRLPVVRARVRAHMELKRKSDLLVTRAACDSVTILPDRSRFDETLEVEWRRALREQCWLSLIMANIDSFKAFNREYGHAAGNDCLRMVAQALTVSLRRAEDFLARLDGSDFGAILPGTDFTGASSLGEKLRQEVMSLDITHDQSAEGDRITISVGIASMVPRGDASPDLLTSRACEMLHEAKRAGINQVRSASL